MTSDAAAAPPRPRESMPGHMMQIRVELDVVLGSLRMPLADVMALGQGSIVALDRKLGDLVDVAVNGRIVARGEVVALENEPDRLGVVIREILRAGEGR